MLFIREVLESEHNRITFAYLNVQCTLTQKRDKVEKVEKKFNENEKKHTKNPQNKQNFLERNIFDHLGKNYQKHEIHFRELPYMV